MMSRDSGILRVLQLLAVLLAVVVMTITNPAEYGLSPLVLKWIGLASTLMGTAAGWLSTSPLPGKPKGDR
jgi:hypothetical protein